MADLYYYLDGRALAQHREDLCLHRLDGPAIERDDGVREWYYRGKRHRLDGPAVEWPDGSGWWYAHDLLHRADGPAITFPDGTCRWYYRGRETVPQNTPTPVSDDRYWYAGASCPMPPMVGESLHRLDGPAVELADGTREWWVDGQRHRPDGPAVIWPNGDAEWWFDGQLHRADGPALIRASGDQEWWFKDKLHRLDGPAVEGSRTQWWYNGKQVTPKRHAALKARDALRMVVQAAMDGKPRKRKKR